MNQQHCRLSVTVSVTLILVVSVVENDETVRRMRRVSAGNGMGKGMQPFAAHTQ